MHLLAQLAYGLRIRLVVLRGGVDGSAEYDYYDREIANYQYMLTAVRNAMNYAAGQGRAPQPPPYRV
jgi:hypothetical protein